MNLKAILVTTMVSLSFVCPTRSAEIFKLPPNSSKTTVVSIGIDNYVELPPLPSCVRSAQEVAHAFKNSADTTTIVNPTRDNLLNWLQKTAVRTKKQDMLVVYFSGHCIYDKDLRESYLCLSDTRSASLHNTAISFSELNSFLDREFASNRLLVFDSPDPMPFEEIADREAETIGGEDPRIRGLLDFNVTVCNVLAGHDDFVKQFSQFIRGDADRNGDGVVTLFELNAFLTARKDQFKIAMSRMENGRDFVLNQYVKNSTNPKDSVNIIDSKSLVEVEPLTRSVQQVKLAKPSTAWKRSGKDYAVIFAVKDFDDERLRLRNPLRDAELLQQTLHDRFNFEVEVVANPDQDAIINVLRRYKKEMQFTTEDQLFLFFSTHGDVDDVGEQGFLAARDSSADDKNRKSFFPVFRLVDIVDGINCPHILLALDVCKGGACLKAVSNYINRAHSMPSRTAGDLFGSGSREESLSSDSVIQLNLKKVCRKFIAASEDSDVSDGRDHSPFAKAVAKELDTAYDTRIDCLELADLRSKVRRVGSGVVGSDFGIGDPFGDFLFIPTDNSMVKPLPAASRKPGPHLMLFQKNSQASP